MGLLHLSFALFCSVVLHYFSFSQHKTVSQPKFILSQRVPTKKDTLQYTVILSGNDTLRFDMNRMFVDKSSDQEYKIVLTIKNGLANLKFLSSDSLVATVVCSIRNVRSDTSQVFNIEDLTKPWYLSITKTYYCENENAVLKTDFDAIDSEKIKRLLYKAIR